MIVEMPFPVFIVLSLLQPAS